MSPSHSCPLIEHLARTQRGLTWNAPLASTYSEHPVKSTARRACSPGFTLIELLIVVPERLSKCDPRRSGGGNYFYIAPANGVCASSDAYKLRDGDNHDTTTLTQLPDYITGVTGSRYCSASGLHACNC